MMDVAFSVQEANVKLEKVGYVPFLESTYSRAGHAPEMCFLKHLYMEYLTSSRPRDLNGQGIKGSFPKLATAAAACQ